MHDVQFSFETRLHFTPWTFSSRSPMTDVEHADDTVLVSRTQLTLHCFLHSLQHEASKRGLLLNPGTCQLLRLHSNLSIISHLMSPHFPLAPACIAWEQMISVFKSHPCSQPNIFCTGPQLSLLASDGRVSLPLSRLHKSVPPFAA